MVTIAEVGAAIRQKSSSGRLRTRRINQRAESAGAISPDTSPARLLTYGEASQLAILSAKRTAGTP